MRVLALHLPNWPIQRLLAARPELRGRPVALYAESPRRGERVVAMSDVAQRRGVRAGMPLAEADSLNGLEMANPPRSIPVACGSGFNEAIRFLRHDPPADRAALTQLALFCERFSPLVASDDSQGEPCDLLLDVTGLGRLFQSEENLVRLVSETMAQGAANPDGYPVIARLAIADTVGAAWALARFSQALRSNQQITRPAKDAILLPPGREHLRRLLAPLPVAGLRIAEETVTLLHELGVTRIGELLKLPRRSLAARFGEQLPRRIAQLLGEDEECLEAIRPPTEFFAEHDFEHPATRPDAIAAALEDMMTRLAKLLEKKGQGATRLVTRIRCGDAGRDIHVGLFQPTARADHWFELTNMQLARMRLPAAVTSLSVEATLTAELCERQVELFGQSSRDHPRRLAELVDRLSSRLGREAVTRPVFRHDAQPERACDLEPLAGNLAATHSSGKGVRRFFRKTSGGKNNVKGPKKEPDLGRPRALPGWLNPSVRPLRILEDPAPLTVIAIAPHGPPMQFSFHNRHYRVAEYWGPERIETGWWRGRSLRRDYYRVQTDRGARFWIFRRLCDRTWFLQGVFE